jgi:ubiquinone/menaquinone biosynthesis C-methylase UbiE
MTSTVSEQSEQTEQWGADFFGGLNEMPPEAVDGIAQILEAMGTEPGFQSARRALLEGLELRPGAAVLEAGCGTGSALGDLIAHVGTAGTVRGVDPTAGFVEAARRRAAAAGAGNATYEIGDIRDLPVAANSFDAAFCDKVLIHAGPAVAALGELKRVTCPGGRVGALEWLPYFALSSTRPDLVARLNGMFRQALYDYDVSANLARRFRAVGLVDVHTRAFLAQSAGLDEHPFWRAFLVAQMPMFVHAGLLAAEEAEALVADLEERNAAGEFSGSFIIHICVGTKPV